MLKRILVIFAALMILFTIPASASSSYTSYVYDSNGFWFTAPDAFTYVDSLDMTDLVLPDGTAVGEMLEPSDLCVSEDGLIYVCDTGNKRIIVLNSDYTLNKIIDSFKNVITDENGNKVTITDYFSKPTSCFANPVDGTLYICDQNGATLSNTDAAIADNITEGTSGRVIQLKSDGTFIRCIAGITSSVLKDDFIFQPVDIVVDYADRIFILSYGFNMGVMELDEYGEFVGCLGAPDVTYNPLELIMRMFSTEAQKERMESYVPTEYSGIDVDDEGFLYVTNQTFTRSDGANGDMLRKLNAKGKDTLRKTGDIKPFGDTDASWYGTYRGPSRLTDVMSLENDVYAVLDRLRGKVFFYNVDGINLFEFGAVFDSADKTHTAYVDGTFEADGAVSMEWINNCCIVLDSKAARINVYEMTDYAEMILEATKLHAEDQYDEEVEIWKKVLVLNNNSVAAKQAIGKVYYRNGDYDTAMKYFKEILDTENYSKAYKYKRQEIIGDYFGVGVAAIVLLIVLVTVGKRIYKKFVPPVGEKSFLGKLKFANKVMFRPLNAPWILTREGYGSVGSATVLLAAAAIMTVLHARFTGFIFSPMAQYTNMFGGIASIVVPLLLFCICNWCVTSLLAGEGNFKAIYISACYSLTPILYLYPVAIIISNVMVAEEGDFFSVFVTLALAWVLMLIFFGNMRIHDYTLGMAVIEIVITVVVMVFVVFIAILFFALCQQMYDFISDVIEELATRS